MLGVNLSVATPERYRPDAAIWNAATARAKQQGASLQWTSEARKAVAGADIIYTDVWVSMGQERERAERCKVFRAYQLNEALLKHARVGCRIMHCLPAHRGEEISEAVMESARSLIFQQAENRLHVQKALLALLFNKQKSQ
jgi:ornithine carbamoyltransferase